MNTKVFLQFQWIWCGILPSGTRRQYIRPDGPDPKGSIYYVITTLYLGLLRFYYLYFVCVIFARLRLDLFGVRFMCGFEA